MQNMHDLLVGTLSIGIPSLILLHLGGKYSTESGRIANYIHNVPAYYDRAELIIIITKMKVSTNLQKLI